MSGLHELTDKTTELHKEKSMGVILFVGLNQ
jgi:hypothetical protein